MRKKQRNKIHKEWNIYLYFKLHKKVRERERIKKETEKEKETEKGKVKK